MPPALDEGVKNRVWRLWLSGETRKNISEVCGISAGSVTNIVNEHIKGLDSSEYGVIRDLAIQLKKEDMTFAELAAMYRRHNYVNKLGANEEEVESLIANLLDGASSLPQEKIVDLVNQLFQLSKSESMPPAEVPAYVNQKIEEKKSIEQEIQKARDILDQEKIDIRTIEEYKKLEEELKKYGLSMETPSKLVPVLRTLDETGYDSQKIVASLARIKSLRGTERRLKDDCKILESRAVRYQKIFPVCERVVSMGIGIPLLLALEIAVIKKIEVDGVLPSSAPFRVTQEIEEYNRLGGMKKQLANTAMQIYTINQISACQNDAINTFMKLRLSGMTEDHIVQTCKVIEANGHNSSGAQSMNSQIFPVF